MSANQPSAAVGITGNQQAHQQAITAQHQAVKTAWQKHPRTHIIIGATLLGVALTLVTLGLGIFWQLIAGGAFIFAGKRLTDGGKDSPLKDVVWLWPGIIKNGGWVAIITTLLYSGAGELTKSWVEAADEVMSCAAEPYQDKCAERVTVSQKIKAVPAETSGPQLSRLGSFTVKVAPGGRSVDIISYDNARLRYEWVAGPTSVEVHPQDDAGNPLPRQAKYWLELPASATGEAVVRFYREK